MIERAACRLVDCPRATIQYVSRREPDDPTVIDSMRKIASQRLRFGRRRVHFLMGREGFDKSERRFRRMYRAQNLQVRARKKRHVQHVRGTAKLVATKPNQCWSLDFLRDILLNRRKFRVLDIIDDFTRINLQSISHSQAVRLRASSMKSHRTAADIPTIKTRSPAPS